MKTRKTRATVGWAATLLLSVAGFASADPVESVTGLDVHNPAAFLAALDRYYQTDVAQAGNVVIWAAEFSGESKVSHLAIAQSDSYADYESGVTARNSSPEWGAFVGSLSGLIDVESRLMAIERFRDGSGWQGHGAMAAFVMTVSDPAAYAAAFADFTREMGHPGSVRLMEMRFGGQGSTHAVLISAANSAELNEYLDELLSSDAYRDFNANVSGIRRMNAVSMFRRVVSYGD